MILEASQTCPEQDTASNHWYDERANVLVEWQKAREKVEGHCEAIPITADQKASNEIGTSARNDTTQRRRLTVKQQKEGFEDVEISTELVLHRYRHY